MSLTEALEEREARCEADEIASSLRLQATRSDGDRFAREAGFLREVADSLRVELADALAAAAKSENGRAIGGNGVQGEVSPSRLFSAAKEGTWPAGGNGGDFGEGEGPQEDGEVCRSEGQDVREEEADEVVAHVDEEEGEMTRGVKGVEGGSPSVTQAGADSGEPEAGRGDLQAHAGSGTAPPVAGREGWLEGGYDGSTGDFMNCRRSTSLKTCRGCDCALLQ